MTNYFYCTLYESLYDIVGITFYITSIIRVKDSNKFKIKFRSDTKLKDLNISFSKKYTRLTSTMDDMSKIFAGSGIMFEDPGIIIGYDEWDKTLIVHCDSYEIRGLN